MDLEEMVLVIREKLAKYKLKWTIANYVYFLSYESEKNAKMFLEYLIECEEGKRTFSKEELVDMGNKM